MLKFFRKIRLELLSENSFPKYLIYALGEILLVVIGILIALQINNWNEARKQDAIIKTHLQNLQEDIQANQEKLVRISKMYSFKYHSLQYLLKIAKAPAYDVTKMNDVPQAVPPLGKDNYIWNKPIPETYNKEFIELAFLWSHRVLSYESYHATFEEIKSTGVYSLIKSQALKKAINKYYEDWNVRFRIIMRELTNDWQDTVQSDGVITSNVGILEDPMVLIKNKPDRIAKIYRLIRECAWWADGGRVLTVKSQELLQLLEEEIAML